MNKQDGSIQPLALTADEAAKALRICTRTLRNLELRGLLKPCRIGQKKLYSRSELERFLVETANATK